MSDPLRITVLGAGNWGTTLAHVVARNGHDVLLWSRDPRVREEIDTRHSHERSLPGVALSSRVRAVAGLDEALDRAELIFAALPSQAFRAVCREVGNVARPEHLIVHGTKGLEAGSHKRMSEVLVEETCLRQLGVVAGPNIAREVADGKLAATLIATRFPRVSALAHRALDCSQLRVFDSADAVGVELCGALKNVVAIAAGMADQLEVGENAKAFLMTRGLNELMRLAHALGAEPATTAGLAGVGDLMVTCSSPLSRNHRVGVALAKGARLEDAVRELGMVAEGVHASSSARELGRAHGLELPLFDSIYRVLHEGLPVADALEYLTALPTGRDLPRWMRAASSRASGSPP